jgi:acyl carrier protein
LNILPGAEVQTHIEQKIRQFITDNFLFREDRASLTDAESLLEAGVIDSTGVLELVAFLEREFGLAVDDAEIVPENLDSISRIVGYVKGKTE